MTIDELAAKLLEDARFMVSSGQFRGTLREYVGFHRGRGEAWERVIEMVEQEEGAKDQS